MPVDLTPLFEPSTVAVVGASNDPTKWGHILSRRALESGSRRSIALVNQRGGEVLGRPTYRSLTQARVGLGSPLDLVVVCLPADALVSTVTDAVGAGARAVVAITAGLKELGGAGARIEEEAVAVARAAGAVLVGPNCLGIADTGAGLQLSHAVLPPGDIAVLSQSGNLVLDLSTLLVERGLGISRFVSVGNQADLTIVDLMRTCVGHQGTRGVAVYAEDVVDGRGFVAAARELAAAGKPVVLLSPGRSDAASRSAVSHTGSMTSSSVVVDAACEAGGVLRVEQPVQMADLLEGLLGPRRMGGRDVAVLTDGGGHGAMAADALFAAGLEIPVLADGTRDAVRRVLWPGSTVTNPVDLAGAGDRDPTGYARAVEALLVADEVDAVLMTGWFGGHSTEPGGLGELELEAARAIVRVVGDHAKPVVVHTIFPHGPTSTLLRAAGIPVHRHVDRACAVLAGLESHPLPAYDEGPVAAAPAITEATYDAARRLLSEAGIAFPVGRIVSDSEAFEAAMAEVGFPLVLKALGSVHKSESGGVVLGLADELTARAAYRDLRARLDPPAVSVEAMADLDAGVELIAGCVREHTFGPVLMVGLGGIHAEVLADTACALAPVSPEQVRRMLLGLRGAPLLLGARGRSPVDIDAVAAAASALSVLAAQHPELAEVEVNPLLARPSGALALDARVVLAR